MAPPPAHGRRVAVCTCHSRIYNQLKSQRQERQGGDTEGEEAQEAPAPQQQRERQRRQRQQQRQAVASPTGGGSAALEPGTKRRRKQARPLREPPPERQLRQDSEPSLPPTMLVKGADEAAVSEGPREGLPGVHQRACLWPALLLTQQSRRGPSARTRASRSLRLRRQGPTCSIFLERAMDVPAAAAASGLTSALVGAFAPLPPLEARRVSLGALLPGSCVGARSHRRSF